MSQVHGRASRLPVISESVGRVESWSGCLGSAYRLLPLSFGSASLASPCFAPALPHQTVRAVYPHTAFRCPSPRGMRNRPACRRRHLAKSVSGVRNLLRKACVPGPSRPDLVPLSQVGPQSFFQVSLEANHAATAIAVVKVARPSPEQMVDFCHDGRKGQARAIASRQGLDPRYDPLHRTLRRLQATQGSGLYS